VTTVLQTLPYAYGHALAFVEYGNPQGWPILVQHGLIASIQARDPANNLFAELIRTGARVICAARPGYGQSSPYPLRTIGEWCEIIARLADHLGLEQMDVLGVSSGAPYAYAVAACLPPRVRNLFILSGTPALYDPEVQACWPYPLDAHSDRTAMQALAYSLFFAHLSAADREQDDFRDSMANGCFGVGQDLYLRCRDWGFRLQDLETDVFLRHSQADEAVPFVTAELTARRLPSCTFSVRETDPHFSPAVLDDFIRTVIAARHPAAV
jgi:pimeloyl-ACP methyl ester carboxylesterase